MMRTFQVERRHRSKDITLKGGIALLICFLIGLAAMIILLYTLL
jgi:hypothetical protein